MNAHIQRAVTQLQKQIAEEGREEPQTILAPGQLAIKIDDSREGFIETSIIKGKK